MTNRRLGTTATLGLVILAAACGGSDDGGTSSGTPAKVLVSSGPAAPDGTCPGGGTKLDFGADVNGNGALDPDEVTASQVVCSPAPGAPVTLTTVTPSGPSDKCKNGGTTVKSGADTNRNGKLDDAEVTDTREICGSGSGVQLAKTEPIAEGDPRCPFGGALSSVGLDNGKGGGVPSDGVLQDGEIVSNVVTCPTGLPYQGTFAPPPGAAGTSKILATGGDGSSGAGGHGGLLSVGFADGGTLGGNVAIFKTGKVDASFTLKPPTPSYGATKLEVAADLTLAERANSDEAAVGEYYVLGFQLLYKKSDAEPKVAVTGIHVAAGATLTFPADVTLKDIAHDIVNEGVLTTPLTSGNRGSLALETKGRYISTAGSKVALAGAAVAGAAGGDGGSFTVNALGVFADGAIDTSGADGDGSGDGGDGGAVSLKAAVSSFAGPVELAGAITTTGGSAMGHGGAGGTVQVVAQVRGVRDKAVLDQSGGSGAGGGDGGALTLVSASGELRVSGSRTSEGGDVDAAACAATCAGGHGGDLLAGTLGADVTWSADNIANAGASKGVPGVDGASFAVVTLDQPSAPVSKAFVPAGSIHASGTFDVRAGSGSVGGEADQDSGFLVQTGAPRGQEVVLLGYDALDASGGDGTTKGGDGGAIQVGTLTLSPGAPPGSVINYASLTAQGGEASAGEGGAGGQVIFFDLDDEKTTGSHAVVSAGAIDASGGAGTSGGTAAAPQFLTVGRVDLLGPIVARGGSATGDGEQGGGTSAFGVTAPGALTVRAPITLAGGDGTGAGGIGGSCSSVELYADEVDATAAITCAGGKGKGAAGGHGGSVHIASAASASSVMSVTAPGGTGTPDGDDGIILVDGAAQ